MFRWLCHDGWIRRVRGDGYGKKKAGLIARNLSSVKIHLGSQRREREDLEQKEAKKAKGNRREQRKRDLG